MKSKIYSFFIQCAGSDEDILNKCPRSEHIKHAGFGALVLVPATLGLFSMTYAISTFVTSPYLYILAGLTWASIVFIFDRFIISSFRKKGSVLKDVTSLTFLSRLVFSAFVGIAVAHPLILLYFHESIEVNMNEVAHAKVDSIENVYQLQKKNLQLQTDNIDKNLTGLSDTIHLQEGILHDEIKGVVRGDDRTTGRSGEGPTHIHTINKDVPPQQAINHGATESNNPNNLGKKKTIAPISTYGKKVPVTPVTIKPGLTPKDTSINNKGLMQNGQSNASNPIRK